LLQQVDPARRNPEGLWIASDVGVQPVDLFVTLQRPSLQ